MQDHSSVRDSIQNDSLTIHWECRACNYAGTILISKSIDVWTVMDSVNEVHRVESSECDAQFVTSPTFPIIRNEDSSEPREKT